MPLEEGVEAQEERRPHDLGREVPLGVVGIAPGADARRVAEEDVALQPLQLSWLDGDVLERAEAGGDAVVEGDAVESTRPTSARAAS